MKVIVAGSRDAPLLIKPILFDYLDTWIDTAPTEIVSGKCHSGPDLWGEEWAESRRVLVEPFPANWNLFGGIAGPLRNKQMAKYGEFLVLAWDGQSKGSRDMFKCMWDLKKPIWEIKYRYEGSKLHVRSGSVKY